MSRVLADVDAVVQAVRASISLRPVVGVVLGSGLGGLADELERPATIPFAELPGIPRARVPGHDGRLVVGHLDGIPVAFQRGRIHLYEGHSVHEVVLPVRALVALGAKTIVLTSAAGGLREAMEPGDVGVLTDQINLTGRNPLVGANDDRLGPRFPDMTNAYAPVLVDAAFSVAPAADIRVHRAVYAQVLGPSYETPAEVRYLRSIGADLVGMSTAVEAVAARHMGARLAGLSCVTNRAAGLGGGALSHDEVREVANRAAARMWVLLRAVIDAAGKR